jgi:putative transposase
MATSATLGRRSVFQVHTSAGIVCETLAHYRDKGIYELHAFVVMRDHLHVLLTPSETRTLEQCMQFIKGGSSARLKKGTIWQKGYNEQSIQSADAYRASIRYVEANPEQKAMADWPFASNKMQIRLDPMPSHLSG